MVHYPIFLELKGRRCLVIGAGAVAARKAKMLAGCGARVRVVGAGGGKEIRRLAGRRKVSWVNRSFKPSDLRGVELVVAATDSPPVNKQASRLARHKGIWINVVDQPRLCSFLVPSVVRRGKLTLAVSTGGASPALSKWIRKDLEGRYGPEFSRLLGAAAKVRPEVIRRFPGGRVRKGLFEKALRAYFRALKTGGS